MLTPTIEDAMRRPQRMRPDRLWTVTSAVVLTHLGLGWAIVSGILTTVTPTGNLDNVIMANVIMDAPAPPAPPAPAPRLVPASFQAKATPQRQTPTKSPIEQPTTPIAAPDHPPPAASHALPSEAAPVVPEQPATVETTPATTATTATTATPATGNQRPSTAQQAHTHAPAQVVQPSTNADYLNNPSPTYPRISKRMGEQGTVVIRVFINTEGRAEHALISRSSGYTRLDDTALATVKGWHFVPGQRNGAPEAMWFNVPIRFVLD